MIALFFPFDTDSCVPRSAICRPGKSRWSSTIRNTIDRRRRRRRANSGRRSGATACTRTRIPPNASSTRPWAPAYPHANVGRNSAKSGRGVPVGPMNNAPFSKSGRTVKGNSYNARTAVSRTGVTGSATRSRGVKSTRLPFSHESRGGGRRRATPSRTRASSSP